MMRLRKLLVITLLFLTASDVCGQTIDFSTNAPRSGDAIKKKQVEYFNPGNSGNNVLWDFRDIELDGEERYTKFFDGPDTLLWSTDNSCICRYQLTSDSLLLYGYETPYQQIVYSTPLVLQTYPYAYGYTMSNIYEGAGLYCEKHSVKNRGTLIVEIDGEGSVITANGDTLSNAVRLHSIRTSSLCMFNQTDTLFSDSSYIKQEIQETNQWYVRGYRYPLYETTSTAYYDHLNLVSCIQRAFIYSPEDQNLPDDPENDKILEEIEREKAEKMDIIHYHVTHDGSTLQIDYSLDAEANIHGIICNSMGMVYGRQVTRQHEGTNYQLSFNILTLPRGEYILYINVNGKVYNEKFEKKS